MLTPNNPIDEETYGEKTSKDPEAIKQGNPGRPQSELGPFDDEGYAGDGPSTGDAGTAGEQPQ